MQGPREEINNREFNLWCNTIVAVTDLFSLVNQRPHPVIRPHTDQSGAERIDSLYLWRIFSSNPFWKSPQAESTELAVKKDLSLVFFYRHSKWKIFTEDNTATHYTHKRTSPVACHTSYLLQWTPITNPRINTQPVKPKRTFSHSDLSLLLL